MRTLRVLAMVAVTALTVVASMTGTAGAKVFNAEVGAIDFSGSGSPTLTIEGQSIICTSAAYSGEANSAPKELEVDTKVEGCTAFGSIAATVKFEGCKFRFDATTTNVDIVCPPEKVIVGTAGTCKIEIGPQENIEAVKYVNNAGPPKSVTVEAAVSGFEYKKTDGFLCPLVGSGTGTSGQFVDNVLVKGFQGEEQIGVFVDPAGVFNAEIKPPVSILGEQAGEPFIFTIENGTGIECKKATYTGEVNKAVQELEVLPSYSECNVFGAAATVNMEGCKYRFNANTNDVDLVCPAGKVVKATVGTCEVQFGSQEGLKSITYVNNGGPPKTVTVEAAVTGVKYNKTKDGALCPLAGTGEKADGEFTGDTLVKGFQGETQVGVLVG